MERTLRLVITWQDQVLLVASQAMSEKDVGAYYTIPRFTISCSPADLLPEKAAALVWEYFGLRPSHIRLLHHELSTDTLWYHLEITAEAPIKKPEAPYPWQFVALKQVSHWSFADQPWQQWLLS